MRGPTEALRLGRRDPNSVSGSNARVAVALALLATASLQLACSDDSGAEPARWSVVHERLDGALTSIWGTSSDDVWTVGGDPGDGPMVLHWDGAAWSKLDTGTSGDLWWVFGFEGGPIFMSGTRGHILRYQDETFTLMPTPTEDTVFGVWGTSPTDMWAVGGSEGGAGGAFAWRLRDDAWVLAEGFPADVALDKVLWKVWGRDANDVWLVGTAGAAVHWDGASFESANLGGGESLFTVHYAAGRFAAVGGFGTGLLFENDGSSWKRLSDATFPALTGVCLTADGGGYAVGTFGSVMERSSDAWHEIEGPLTGETLHAAWVDPDGGLWVAGGQVQTLPLIRGILAYRGSDRRREVSND